MTKPSRRTRFARALARLIAGPEALAAVSVRVDDSDGWIAFHGGPNDRDYSEIQTLYQDTLEAWRKNPMAKRIVDTISDYCLGDGLQPAAGGTIGRFVGRFWAHPQNDLLLRLPEYADELSRAGDLFLTLHRNPADGMSYVRAIPKDRIVRIETAPNDWEDERAYIEIIPEKPGETRRWLAPGHPAAAEADAIMLHFAVNRVVGALLGESDLATLIPWLRRYSRALEDRLRLHWAARAFLWMVTVPAGKVKAKREQYSTAPESGAVIVKDDSETWEPVNPELKGFDAQFDLRAVRMMIDAGSGLPPHWRGEPFSVSLATSRSMDRAAARHLRRRQLYLQALVIDLAHCAYTRAWEIGKQRAKPDRDAITAETTDIDRQDNQELAVAARDMSSALDDLAGMLDSKAGRSHAFRRLVLRLVLRFAGEPLDDPALEEIIDELGDVQLPEAGDQEGIEE
ncbi:MAG: hypothetical protein PVJ34_10740 [Anaerolineae bacterium]|jgi:hypothetical protein